LEIYLTSKNDEDSVTRKDEDWFKGWDGNTLLELYEFISENRSHKQFVSRVFLITNQKDSEKYFTNTEELNEKIKLNAFEELQVRIIKKELGNTITCLDLKIGKVYEIKIEDLIPLEIVEPILNIYIDILWKIINKDNTLEEIQPKTTRSGDFEYVPPTNNPFNE
jgi:hypothetical protein